MWQDLTISKNRKSSLVLGLALAILQSTADPLYFCGDMQPCYSLCAGVGATGISPLTGLQVNEELPQEFPDQHEELVQAQFVYAKPLSLHGLHECSEIQQSNLHIVAKACELPSPSSK